jgi:dolichol-phosphate mannosyltransferase
MVAANRGGYTQEKLMDEASLGHPTRLGGPELAIVIPSFNERENIVPLLERLEAALRGLSWEVIYVDDDSPDGTAGEIRRLAQKDRRIRCMQRIGRRGLSTAVIEGLLATSAPYLAVIDADMQHDEKLLPRMLETLKAEQLDVVIGSRYATGGGLGAWETSRAIISRVSTRLAHVIAPADLSDPMSGFFMLTRPAFERAVRHLSGQGFKILLDLFASTPSPYRFKEIPYVFSTRAHGESKLDSNAVWEYLLLLLDKLSRGLVPVRFILFAAVGGSGVFVHLVALKLALTWLSFAAAQGLATYIAMTSNFVLNNILTYRDKRLRGISFITGLISFYAVCSVGAVANVGIASVVYAEQYAWWISGLAGALIGVVWNYAVSSIFTWRRK